jgi:hypothetical protein
MEIEDFKRIGEDLFGNGWQTRLSRALGVDGSTVRRWVGSANPLPPAVIAYLDMLASRQRTRGALILERQRLGEPVAVAVADPIEIEWMTKRLVFPGVDQPKPMPAIICDGATLSLNGDPADMLAMPKVTYVLTRHPDSQHLAGYLAAAARHHHRVAVLKHRHHHYTALIHRWQPACVVHQICTHAGEIRTLSSYTFSPQHVESSHLERCDAG